MIAKLLYLLLCGIGSLPLALRRQLGAVCGLVAAKLPSREKAVALAQLQWLLPSTNHAAVVTEIYRNLGRNIAESLNLAPILKASDTNIGCETWGQVDLALSEGRGAVCLTAHLGNWDLLGAWAVKKGVRLSTVGREARSPTLQYVLKRLRGAYGIHTIWRSNRAGLKEIVDNLKSGHVVAALIDQDTRVKSLFAPFFGVPARTPSALVELGIKHRAPILAAFMWRSSDSSYKVSIHRLSQSQDAVQVLAEYNSLLESLVRAHPEQWVWFHKRWRSQVNGPILRTSEYLEFLAQKSSRAA